MRERPLIHVDPVTRSAGAALLCSALTEFLATRQSEFYSEVLAWAILPVLSKTARSDAILSNRNIGKPDVQPVSGRSLWTVAFGVAVVSLSKAENGMVTLFPVLTPLLLAVQKHHGCERERETPTGLVPRFFSHTLWGTFLVALFTMASLSVLDIQQYALSIIPVIALLVVYIILTPKSDEGSRFLPYVDIEHTISALAVRVVVLVLIILDIEAIAFGFPGSEIFTTMTLGLTKALTWYFVIQTARHSSWRTASSIGTFAIISTRDPFTQSSGLRALSHVIGSSLALGQVIHILPRQAKARSALWGILLVSVVPYLANITAIKLAESSLVHSHTHPVEYFIRNAKVDFDRLVQRQSSTYNAADAEYQRRYSVEPPPGFNAWFEFAKSHQSPIIDDFDAIYESISPFWKLSGQQILETMNAAQNTPGSELWLCTFSGHQATTHCSHPYRVFDRDTQLLFDRLLKNLGGILPDVKFLVNHLDEPRVLIPPSLGAMHANGGFHLADLSKRPVWDILTKSCVQKSGRTEQEVKTFGLPFISEPKSAMDLCRHPEYSVMHGLTLSPTSFRPIEGLVPILSTGAPSTMGDIIYPSPAYIESEFEYAGNHDVEWDKKRNNLYWAGSTTGGFAIDDQWRHYLRHRFVALAQNLETRQHSYLRERDEVVSRVESSFLNSRLFDVAFTRIFQCETTPCRDQRAYFHVKPWENKDQALRSRLVFDTDGNGISGRYYKLLASKSAPLKQTLLREWHDERLVPWVHYVPVSLGMEELPELVSYLTSTEAGRERAREIAELGRDWFSRAFREVDLTIYVYRLLLELARLQDPNRPAF